MPAPYFNAEYTIFAKCCIILMYAIAIIAKQ